MFLKWCLLEVVLVGVPCGFDLREHCSHVCLRGGSVIKCRSGATKCFPAGLTHYSQLLWGEERRRGRGKLYCEYPVILFGWDYIDLKGALGVI